MSSKVTCSCGWLWDKKDSSKKDMYVCHQCGKDNTMKDGGWLSKYDDGGPVQENYNDADAFYSEDYVGAGYDIEGRNYSPAWGGSFQMGGSVYPVNYVPEAQMGASVPGAVGFSYARTQGSAPSNGKYAKKTMASAQNGKEMQFYQNGLDFQPKSISRDGVQLDKAQIGAKKFKLRDERDLAYRPAESTNIKKKNFDLEQDKERKNYLSQLADQQKENSRRKKLTQDQREREDYNARSEQTGTISKYVPESTWDRSKAIASNPLTAFGYAARNESLPARFQHGERNVLDNAIDWVNPLQGVAAVSEIPGELGRGEYLNAGLSLLDAADLGVYAKGAKKQLRNVAPALGYREGGIIKDDRGQWDHPWEDTEISGDTMRTDGYGNIPLYVVPDVGEARMVYPNTGTHTFPGATKFTEYPKGKKPNKAQNGLRQEQKGLQNLDNLTNFTNYNKPQPGSWLEKYN